jgi:putative peptide zinc metalloprotease protein
MEEDSRGSQLMPKQVLGQASSFLVLFFKLFKSWKVVLAVTSLAAYSFLFTWQFAIAIMYAIGVHEMGHVWAMRRTGMRTPGFYFIPLLGGAAIAERARNEWQDVYITAMGPSWGLFSAIPPALLFTTTGDPMWAGVVAFIALLNLFNLLPIFPLDGGRLTQSLVVSVAPGGQLVYLVFAGALVVALAVYMRIYFVAILFALGVMEIYFERRRVRTGELSAKPPLNRDGLIVASVWYGGLALIFLLIIFGLRDVAGGDLALRVLRDG